MRLNWNPFREMVSLSRELDRVFEGFGAERFWPLTSGLLSGRLAGVFPRINIREDADAIYVEAVAPGVDPDSLSTTIRENVLTIAGERKGLPDLPAESCSRSERSAGKFVRAIELPVEVDANKVKAEYVNGLLRIELPKAEKAKPKQIAVKVG